MPEIYSSDEKSKEKPASQSSEAGGKSMDKTNKKTSNQSAHAPKHNHSSNNKSKPHKTQDPDTQNDPPTMNGMKETRNPFAAFMVKPSQISVAIQDIDEKILLLLRRHVITNLGWLLIALLMFAAPLILAVVPLIEPLPPSFKLMTLIFWYLITTGFIIEQFLSWYFNVFVITDERIIDIDFLNLLYRNVSTGQIENIEEVSAEVTGAIRSIFNYGDVYIQTAAEEARMEFEAVPQPQEVAKILHELQLQEEQEKIEGRVR